MIVTRNRRAQKTGLLKVPRWFIGARWCIVFLILGNSKTIIMIKIVSTVPLGRVLGLLFLLPTIILGLATTGEFASNATTFADVKSIGKPEARIEETTDFLKSSRGVEWKSKDSYWEALRHSRTSTDPREGIVADGTSTSLRKKEQPQGPVYATKRTEIQPDREAFSMVRSDSYSLPNRASGDFHGVRNSYGPPRESYGPPSNDYLPPGVYPSSQQQGYGTSYGAAYGPSIPYGHGVGHTMSESVHLGIPSIDFSWPFALKLNAFTLAKILLKLVIFKMIVKFIAVICLLLFIPKLEIKKGNKGSMDSDEEDEGRRSTNADSRTWDRLNSLTLLVTDALEKYRSAEESESRSECSTSECLRGEDGGRRNYFLDYENLLRGYLLEETHHARFTS